MGDIKTIIISAQELGKLLSDGEVEIKDEWGESIAVLELSGN